MRTNERDPLATCITLSSTLQPQRLCWLAMHQDYSSEPVDPTTANETEAEYGRRLIGNCIKFGHWGVIEHPQITISTRFYPHSVMQQARTHRVGVSFDVQSFRFTGKKLAEVTYADLESIIYFRPVGFYTSRTGAKYEYTENLRTLDKEIAYEAIKLYNHKVHTLGMSEEHARCMLPFDYRQHFVVSFNARSLMHFLDLRAKADAQLEIQWLATDILEQFKLWMPEVAEFYIEKRLNRAQLTP